jgi:MarR-like DNA-binding transcriptional regulator SgrR of sgrS sRNA
VSARFVPKRFLVFLIGSCLLAAAAQARTRPHYGGTIRVSVDSDPLQSPRGFALRLVLDGLTQPGSDGEPAVQPALALRWASDDSAHRWQFWLRPGVVFHDGSPLTTIAIVTSLNQSCRMTACPWTALHVSGQSVVFTGESPMPNLPELLAQPEWLIRQAAPPDQPEKPLIGTGPFRIEEAKAATLRLQANDESWQGRPFTDTVEFTVRHAGRDQWNQLTTGKTDLLEIPPSEIRAARQQQLRLTQSPDVTLIALQVNDLNLAPQLRAAIALAVDRTALQQVIFQKQAEITASLLPASLSGYSFLFRTERDLPGALTQRDGINPPPLTLAADNSAAMQLAAQRIALNLHDAGFQVKVVPLLTGLNATQRADLVLRELPVAGGTPAATLEWLLHNLGLNTPVAPTEPVAAFKAEQDFLDQHTVIPLLFLPRAWAASSRLRDLHRNADGLPDLASASLTDTAPSSPEHAP